MAVTFSKIFECNFSLGLGLSLVCETGVY